MRKAPEVPMQACEMLSVQKAPEVSTHARNALRQARITLLRSTGAEHTLDERRSISDNGEQLPTRPPGWVR